MEASNGTAPYGRGEKVIIPGPYRNGMDAFYKYIGAKEETLREWGKELNAQKPTSERRRV